jgi:uncharacterized protein YndB with AHSA1/START domain
VSSEIDIAVRVETTAERAWAAWTDPARLIEWFPDRASGSATPGDKMIYEWDALRMGLELDVVSATPERELVLRGHPPGLPPQTQTIQIAPDGDAVTVSLRHDGLDDDDILHGTASGWTIALRVMKLYLERYYGQPRTNAWILGLAPAQFERVFEHYTGGHGLAVWLGSGGPIGDAGEPYCLDLLDGGVMSGEVLTRYEPREVALGWSEIDGVAALRVFRVAPGAALVGVNMMSWGRPDEQLEPVAGALKSAVDRLVIALGGASASA